MTANGKTRAAGPWPISPVASGESILATQYNVLLNGVQLWPGPVDAGGWALSNIGSQNWQGPVAGGGQTLSSAVLSNSCTLPVATAAYAGAVKVGGGITVQADGTISVPVGAGYVLPIATASVVGGVKQGSGINIAADGTITALAGGSQVNTDWSATSGITEILNKPAITWDGTTSTATAPFAVEQGITVQTASQSMVIGDRGDGLIGMNISDGILTIGNSALTVLSDVYITGPKGGQLVLSDYGVTGANLTIEVGPLPAYASITCNPGVAFNCPVNFDETVYFYSSDQANWLNIGVASGASGLPTIASNSDVVIFGDANGSIQIGANPSVNDGRIAANGFGASGLNIIGITAGSGRVINYWGQLVQVAAGASPNVFAQTLFDSTIFCQDFQSEASSATNYFRFFSNQGANNGYLMIDLSSGNTHLSCAAGDGYLYLDPHIKCNQLSWYASSTYAGAYGQLAFGQHVNSADPALFSATGWLEIDAGVHLWGVLSWYNTSTSAVASLDWGGPNSCARINAGSGDLDIVSNIVTVRSPLSIVGETIIYSPDTTNSLAITVGNGSTGPSGIATANSGNNQLNIVSNVVWVQGQVQATAFNAHARTIADVRLQLQTLAAGAWNLVSAEDGLHIIVARGESVVREFLLPWEAAL